MKVGTAHFCDTFIPNMNSQTVVVKNYADFYNKKYGTSVVVTPDVSNYLDSEKFDVLRYKNHHIIQNLNENEINIVHAHSPVNSGQIALKYAQEKHIPIVCSFHNKEYEDYFLKTDFLAKLKMKKIINFYNKMNLVFVPNENALEALVSNGFKGKGEIIQTGTEFIVNENNRDYVNHKHEISNETRVLLYVGKLSYQKNLRLVIDALINLRKLKQDFRMIFIGEGNDRDDMIKLINDNKLSRFCLFTGMISDRQLLRKYFERADILLFPAVNDIVGQVVYEASGFRVPALIVKEANISQYIKDHYNGYLSENNGLSYAQKIIASLNDKNKTDVGLLAQNTLVKSIDVIVDGLYHKYCEVIEAYK